MIEQRVQHGGDGEHIVDAVVLHSCEPLLGVEARLQNHGAATQQRGQHGQHTGVGNRSRDEGPRVGRQSPGRVQRKHRLDHRAVRDHGGLGPPGGATGVLQPGDVFFLGVTPAERLRSNLAAQRQQVLADVRGPQREQMLDVGGPGEDLCADFGELGMHDENVDLGVLAQIDVVVDGSQWVQPRVHRTAQADRRLHHPDLGGVDAERADATALGHALVLQHLADPTGDVGRLGVGHPGVALDERRAVVVPVQRINDQRGVRDSAV